MFTSIKEYTQQVNTLNSEKKLKHIDDAINKLQELSCCVTLNAIDMTNILKNLKKLYDIRSSIEQLL